MTKQLKKPLFMIVKPITTDRLTDELRSFDNFLKSGYQEIEIDRYLDLEDLADYEMVDKGIDLSETIVDGSIELAINKCASYVYEIENGETELLIPVEIVMTIIRKRKYPLTSQAWDGGYIDMILVLTWNGIDWVVDDIINETNNEAA